MRTEGASASTKVTSFQTNCASCPLRARSCFREFKKEELEFVRWFKRGELVVEAGSPVVQEASTSPHLFTVLEGWAFRYKTLPDGRRQILNFAMPGDLIGLQSSVFDVMDHGVEALTGMVLCLFPRSEFMSLYKDQPSLAYDVTWLAAEQERLLDAQLVTVGRRTAIERVAFVVWYLFDRARDLGMVKNGRIVFPLTQQHMADTLGLSLVHTNKTIKRLRSTGTVRWSERWLEIEDEARLMEIANVEKTDRPKRPFI